MKMSKIEKWFVNRAGHSRRVARRAGKFIDLVNVIANQSYLDVGCGNGAAASYIARKYKLDVTGVDVDPEQIRLAAENSTGLKNIRFLTVDGTQLPFQDGEFDVVSTFKTTHHIPNWEDALCEMARVLKPNGYFVYCDFVFPRWVAAMGKVFAGSHGGYPTIHALEFFLEKNSLRKIHLSRSLAQYETVCRKIKS